MHGPTPSIRSSNGQGGPFTSDRCFDERPIGVFDSGFGGLSIVRALIDLLPGEHIVYVGDTGRYPYGSRPAVQVRAFAGQIARHLVEDTGVKLLVVACNTAASVALDELAASCPVPVAGVIEPGMRAAALATRTGRVGVIGTVGTIASGAYQRLAPTKGKTEVHCAACPGFVEFVERGDTDSDQVHVLAERLLAPLKAARVDTLLLGCTHYPFLARTIADVMGEGVVLVSSAEETAFDVHGLLSSGAVRRARGSSGRHDFFSSGHVESFAETGRRLLGPELATAQKVCFERARFATGKAPSSL